MNSYEGFIAGKRQLAVNAGFDPIWMPEFLHPFQRHLTEWAIVNGRVLLAEDCGLGKTPQQLVWAENVVRKTNKPVILATPIAVGVQTCREAEKFGIQAARVRNGDWPKDPNIVVTNYEQLHHYDPANFGGMVCDESSGIKDFKSARKGIVTEFMRNMKYRLLCTATPAPNDYQELGTSSEALGFLGFRDMLTTFFKMEQNASRNGVGWGRQKWRFRGHAEQPFWSWVCSWARAIRKPSDIGYDDGPFVLPELRQREIVVDTAKRRPGMLITLPARDMREERQERRASINERCEAAAEIASRAEGACALWCDLNPEGDLLQEMVGGDCLQVKGSMSDDEKEEALIAFSTGQAKRIVIKPKIGAWGLNWQHCSDTVVFPTHSYEQYYQLVRRFYRFGQERPVNVSLVMSEGEQGIGENLERKAAKSDRMFQSIVRHMRDAMAIVSADNFPNQERRPQWLSSNK